MDRTLLFTALLAAVAHPSHATGINLSWDECGLSGTEIKTFACDVNSGATFDLVASFVPPAGINRMLGLSAELGVAATNLPDWWKIGSGECRSTSALTVSFSTPAGACTDFWSGNAAGGFLYTLNVSGPNTAKLLVQAAIPSKFQAPVSAAQQYYAFKVHLGRAQTTGSGSCTGCAQPVRISLQQIQLFQPPDANNDPIILNPIDRTIAYWQAATGTQPVISSFTPTAAAPGAIVMIHGAGFTGTSLVQFGDVDATYTLLSDTLISAVVPAGARSGLILVRTPFGTATRGTFIAAPVIQYFLPKQASAGTSIGVRGYNFVGSTAVRFNGAIASFSVDSDSSLHATVPSAATTGPITVVNPGGSTDSDSLFRVGPTTGAVDLAWDNCGTYGTTLKQFACDTNSGPPFLLVGSFVPPPGVTSAVGMTADLEVTGVSFPDWWKLGPSLCRGSSSFSLGFNYGSGARCTDFWSGPTGGAIYTLDYYGPNRARMRIIGSSSEVGPLDTGTQYNGFQIRLTRTRTVFSGACAGCDQPMRITLHQIQLLQSVTVGFDPILYIPFHQNTVFWQGQPGPSPTVRKVLPAAGPVGTPVTLRGLNLSGAIAVRFGAIYATYSVASDSIIQTQVPAGARTAVIFVTTPSGTGNSDSLFIVAPTIVGFLPRQAPPGSTVAVRGRNLTRSTSVLFDDIPASFSVVNDSLVQTTVPTGAALGPISVTNAGGTAVSDSAFRVGPIPSGFFNLSWDDCGLAGTELKTFACNANTGTPFTLVASFVPPPDVSELTSLSAELRIGSTSALPDWWKHGTLACRGGAALSSSLDFMGMSQCTDPWAGRGVATTSYDVGFYGANSARLRVTCNLTTAGFAGPLPPTDQYYAFKVSISRDKSTGASSCAGCATPVSVDLQNLQLTQSVSLGYDPLLTNPLDRGSASWQAAPGPLPSVRAFAPPGGAVGAAVNVLGTYFTGATAVRFGGTNAAFTVMSDTTITTTVPAGANTGPIDVTTIQGTGVSGSAFVVAPALTYFSPRQAPVGYTVSLRGRNFSGATSVKFNGLATTFSTLSDSLIHAPVPSGATDGPISITNPGGTTVSDSVFRVGPLPPGFVSLSWDDCGLAGNAVKAFACASNSGSPFVLYASFMPPPAVDQLTGLSAELRVTSTLALPDWWKHGSGNCRGTSGLLAAFDAGPASCVDYWAGRATGTGAYDVAYYGPNSARLRVNCSLAAGTPGPVDPVLQYYGFKINITPSQSTGIGSCGGCQTPVSIALQQIQLFQPAALLFDPILDVTLDRSVAYWQAIPGPLPTIRSFVPGAGVPGTLVTIAGSHFTGTQSVRFGVLPATFALVDDSTLTANAPADVRTGPIQVATVQGSAISDSVFIVAPTIRSFSPIQAPEGYAVVIRGVNFTRTSVVVFNGLPATFTISSDSLISAAVPLGATDGPIMVTNPGGTATSASAFQVGPLLPGRINLAWDDCSPAGVEAKSFACNINSGSQFTLVASFVPPPAVDELVGLAAEIRVQSTAALPDWWRHGASFCRGTSALSTTCDFTTGPFTCTDFWAGRAAGSSTYQVGYYGANTASLRLVCSIPEEERGPLDPGYEYYAFKVLIQKTKSAGSSSCAGCATPVQLTMNQVQLFQSLKLHDDPIMTLPLVHNVALWQGGGLLPAISSVTPAAGSPGTPVTILGRNFTGASQVTFNTIGATFSVVSDSVINTSVPTGARTGPVDVTTSRGTGYSAVTFIVAPDIATFTPTRAPVNFPISIFGINFTGTTSVSFNGTSATFTLASDSLLSANVPAGVSDGPITVTNPGGFDVSDEPFHVGSAPSGTGVNLSWDDCGNAGTQIKTFTCDTNSGVSTLIASFAPPFGINEFLGLSAQIDITSATSTLPDWWKHGTGQCRTTTGLATNFDFTAGPFSCIDFYVGQAAGGFAYDVGFGAANRARLRVQCAVPFDSRGPVDPATEYYAFKVNLLRAKTTGSGSCTGCLQPMCILLNEVQLFQPPSALNDPILFNPINRNFVHWQSTLPSCASSTPVQASAIRTDAMFDHVRIVWQIGDASPATVYRREGLGAWRTMARVIPDGNHRVIFEDLDVIEGHTYLYRLALDAATGQVFAGETSVTVPFAARALALSRVAWDPAAHSVTLAVTLMSNAPAILGLYDLVGRRWASQTLDGRHAGTHDLRFVVPQALPSGVYFIRLAQAGEDVARRFVLFR